MVRVVRKTKVALVLSFLIVSSLTSAFAASKTYIGEVGDAMCGATHVMGNAVDCTRTCLQKGSKYALIVGDKVFTLDSHDDAILSKLSDLTGKKAAVKGTVTGDTIDVSSVVPAK